jgi:hypothetical protein
MDEKPADLDNKDWKEAEILSINERINHLKKIYNKFSELKYYQ